MQSERKQVELTLPDLQLSFTTDRGVFSAGGVDSGTKLLFEVERSALEQPPDRDRVLVDVGAGYGPIALALAKRNPDAQVWAVEVNGRARDLCAENAEANGLANVRVVSPDDVPDDLLVDRLWSNPPVRVGKAAMHELLDGWLARLSPNGSAHLVVQKHLGADSLHKRLEGLGWDVNRRASRKSFRLLDVMHR